MKNLTENMIKYENGDMEAGEVMQFFQEPIDSGLAWKLQGHYGRTANALIEEGLCRVKAITIDS